MRDGGLKSGLMASVMGERVVSFMKPKPSPFPLLRIGGSRDGAYLVPSVLDDVTACFSPGVANRKNFEDELLEGFGIRSHLMDFSSDVENFETPLVAGHQTFRKKWLSPDGGKDSLSISEWVSREEGDVCSNFLLQMDIEGAEYANILQTSSETLDRFLVLVVEFHDVASRVLAQGEQRRELEGVIDLLSRSFVSVHARINNYCDVRRLGAKIRIPQVLEVTFLRADHFQTISNVDYAVPLIPHPLDISRNNPRYRPVHLTAEWRHGAIAMSSLLKIFVDWADFCVYPWRSQLLAIVNRLYTKLPRGLRSELGLLRLRLGEK